MDVGPTYFLPYAVLKWEQYIAIYYEDHCRGFCIFCSHNTPFTKVAKLASAFIPVSFWMFALVCLVFSTPVYVLAP